MLAPSMEAPPVEPGTGASVPLGDAPATLVARVGGLTVPADGAALPLGEGAVPLPAG